ncbi:uncharacterized protein LOC133925843 [Phragmites australis]|uniref:uncharacterized protein LOC133925843 n=1 Tax=Phragmites australis TaxID=29695 RepID=UPI002D7A1238|nr:uncharacterized protein LOC133925843 [Phragmites australis]
MGSRNSRVVEFVRQHGATAVAVVVEAPSSASSSDCAASSAAGSSDRTHPAHPRPLVHLRRRRNLSATSDEAGERIACFPGDEVELHLLMFHSIRSALRDTLTLRLPDSTSSSLAPTASTPAPTPAPRPNPSTPTPPTSNSSPHARTPSAQVKDKSNGAVYVVAESRLGQLPVKAKASGRKQPSYEFLIHSV